MTTTEDIAAYDAAIDRIAENIPDRAYISQDEDGVTWVQFDKPVKGERGFRSNHGKWKLSRLRPRHPDWTQSCREIRGGKRVTGGEG